VDEGGPLSPGHDDGPVQEALRYLRAWRRCRAEADRQRLAGDMPDLYRAHQLYLARSLQTWEAQARLLTEEPFETIAEKCGSHPRVIETYHETFFHVRDRLHVEGYIVFEVIGPKAHSGLTEADVDVILMMNAYFGGPAALDAVIDCIKDPPRVPERPELLDHAELQSLRDRLLVRAWIALDTLPTDGKALERLEVLREAADVFRRGRGLGDGPDNLKVPLITSPSYREQVFKAPGHVADAVAAGLADAADRNEVGQRAATGPALGEKTLAPFGGEDRRTETGT
jgi:hypothetical protein